MKRHEILGDSDQEARIEEAFAKAEVPPEYQGFARNIADLPSSERNDRIQEMSAADQDFAGYASNIESYLTAYDVSRQHEGSASENPGEEERGAEVSVEHQAAPKEERVPGSVEQPGNWEEQLGRDIARYLGVENPSRADAESLLQYISSSETSGQPIEEVLAEYLNNDREAARKYAAQWEAKYRTAPAVQEQEKERPHDGAPAEGAMDAEAEKREGRFSEATTELQALAKKSPDNKLPQNAIDLLYKIWDEPIHDAVRQVADAQVRDHSISKYHAAVILHALVPDKVPQPAMEDIKLHEPGHVSGKEAGEMSVEQMAEEEEKRPVPGFPKGYVRREKKAAGHAGETLDDSDDSIGQWENEGGHIMPEAEALTEQSAKRVAAERVVPKESPFMDERLAAVRRDLEAERSPSKTLRAALEILDRVKTMPTEEAVRYVINAERHFEILKYHADAILHALIPDRVAKPEEPGSAAGGAGPKGAESRHEEREPNEEFMSPERKILDQQLKDGISIRQDMYRSIRGNKEARNNILDSGSDGIKDFLSRLDVFTKELRPKLSPYVMKKFDLIITTTGETGVPREGDIYVNVDDLTSADFEAVQQLAEKVRRELSEAEEPEEEPEEEPAEPAAEAGTESPVAVAGTETPQESALGARVGRSRPAREDERTFVQRTRERVAETASRLAERFGIKSIADSARIAWSGELADWHTGRAVSLKGKLDGKRRTVQDLEENRRHLQDEFNTLSREGEVSAKALTRIEKDRAEIEKKIEKNENSADRLQSRLEHRNNQRARFENRRDEVCRGYVDRVAERLNPFEEKLSDLKGTQIQLQKEIGQYQAMLSGEKKEVARLKKLVEAEKFSSVKRAHREIIKKIERTAKDLADEIATREKDRGRIMKKIMKQDKKANPLRDKIDRLTRITKRRGPDTSVAARSRNEEASVEMREVSGHPREEAEGTTNEHDAEGAHAESHPELEKKYSGEELVKAWNSVNGSRMMINPDIAKRTFPTFFGEPESAADFLRFAEFYAERHGDENQFEGMPSMQKAAKKRRTRGFWARLFGGGNRGKSQSRLLGALNRR